MVGKAFTVAALLLVFVPASIRAQTGPSAVTPSPVVREAAAEAVPSEAPRFSKVMTIVLENADYEAAIAQPFLASLARRGALLTRFSGETHPSQPNYIALVSGSTQGVHGDENVTIDARHIGDLLEAKGLGWKVYAEDYPGGCFLGAKADGYVRKHVPFLSFSNVQTMPDRCARIVDASTLAQDIRAGTLPEYSLYIPNLRNDGHDTSIAYADHWLSTVFAPLLQDPRFTTGLLLVVTFDEDGHPWFLPSSNHILTVLFGDSVKPGAESDEQYNHYSLLRLVEDQFALGNLGENDSSAPPITGVWK